MGITEVRTVIQKDVMTDELRNSLWNVLDRHIWRSEGFMFQRHGRSEIWTFSEVLWSCYFKLPVDTRPDREHRVLDEIRNYFFNAEWYEVYDFVEFCLWITNSNRYRKLPDHINNVLERELAAYRVVDQQLVAVTDDEQVDEVEEAASRTPFSGAKAHIKQAIQHLSSRQNPDYRNSIKESISAVESACQELTGDNKATLGEALNILKKSGQLHGALHSAFSALYGYTSDADGIRHAMLEESNLTQADAKYFLVTCSSFANYLAEKKANLP